MPALPTTSESHWTRHAAQWGNVGSPLRAERQLAGLPLASGACTLVVGVGSLSVIERSDDYRRCAQELHCVLRPDGCLVLRLFCQPETPEFEFLDANWPRYELGERCPTASFRRRAA